MKRSTIAHNTKVAKNCYKETFWSMQLSSLYCLYYDIDFSKQKIRNFNKALTKHDEEARSRDIDLFEIEHRFRKMGFDCEKEAIQFPFRAKVKMAGKIHTRDMDVAVHNINDAIETYLVLAIYTLRKNYHFSMDKIRQWWQCIRDFSINYATGMNDEHVIEYFIQECGLGINK